MSGDNKDDEFGCCVCWTPDAKMERNADENKEREEGDRMKPKKPPEPPPGCIDAIAANETLRNFIIAGVVFIIILIIAVIVLSVFLVIKPETYLPCPSPKGQDVFCPDFWVGYKGKCFYTSKEEGNWSLSLKTCSSLNASLAVIDTQKELEFWVKTFRPFHYWFGLSREVNQAWKWSDGTEFKNQFPVRGEGFCAYLNGKEADSTLCSMEKLFFCSRTES